MWNERRKVFSLLQHINYSFARTGWAGKNDGYKRETAGDNEFCRLKLRNYCRRHQLSWLGFPCSNADLDDGLSIFASALQKR